MKGPKVCLVMVTAPNRKIARKLANAALKAKLAACVNLIPQVESHYWWQEKIESGVEVLMVLKTSPARLRQLEKVIVAAHPYDTPEFISVPVGSVNKRYLAWWVGALK